MKQSTIILILLVGLSQVGWGIAQQLGSLQRYFVRPELVMRNQQELDLTEAQRNTIVHEIQQAQTQFTGLRWDVQNETQALERLLQARSSDEPELLTQLDKILDLEREIKRTQLVLAVRIRNVLDEQQLRKLEEFREQGIEQQRRNRRPPPQNP
jgi:hypothetical protein